MKAVKNEMFAGIDQALVFAAIKRAGFGINDATIDAARDAVADAIVSYNPNYRKQNEDGTVDEQSKPQKLTAWVYSFLQWQLKRYVQAKLTEVSKLSLDSTNPNDPDSDSCLYNTIESDANVEEAVVRNIMRSHLHQAIKRLDKRGQFVMNFLLKSDMGRCREELGQALIDNGLVKPRGEPRNKRSRAQQLTQQYIEESRKILLSMGVSPEDIF